MAEPIFNDWNLIVQKLLVRRKQLKLSQSQLSELSGISQATISRIEKSDINIELNHILKLASILGFDIKLF